MTIAKTKANLRKKSKATVNLKIGRFNNIPLVDAAVLISSVCMAVPKSKLEFCTVLHALLMMTAESILSKCPVLRFAVALFLLLKLFSSHIYCMKKQTVGGFKPDLELHTVCRPTCFVSIRKQDESKFVLVFSGVKRNTL